MRSHEIARQNALFLTNDSLPGSGGLRGGGCSPAKPVSTVKFPVIREFNRESREIRRFRAGSIRKKERSLSSL